MNRASESIFAALPFSTMLERKPTLMLLIFVVHDPGAESTATLQE
jgi:hypothetical protein